MSDTIVCAIDLSGPFASFAVHNSERLLISKSFLLQNRNNAAFYNTFFETLNAYNITPELIVKWIIGVGPGSFTGLRIASAFVLGITYQTTKTCLGVPSAFPIASALNLKPGETAGILFPYSKEMSFVYGIKNEGNYGLKKITENRIITIKDIDELGDYNRVAYVKNQLTEEFFSGASKNIEILTSFPVENMFYDFKGNYTRIEELLYVRPPTANTTKRAAI